MKKIAFFSIIILLFSCKKQQKNSEDPKYSLKKVENVSEVGYTLTGKAIGYPDSIKVYVNGMQQNVEEEIIRSKIVLDSTIIKNGTFEISLPYYEANDFHFLTFEEDPNYVFYMIENNPIAITVYKDSLGIAKIEGAHENNSFNEYNDITINYGRKQFEIDGDIKKAKKKNDAKKIVDLQNKKNSIRASEKEQLMRFLDSNANSTASLMLLTTALMTKKFEMPEIKKSFNSLSERLQNSRLGKNIATALGSNMEIGDLAKEFSAPTPDGSELSLKDAMGEVTIIDFWASWCKPCRMENPNVVRVYKKYHNKGLNIISVSLDKDREPWLAAIANDEMDWSHISNLKFWDDPIAKSYGVRGIPATFILDAEGKIIAKNLRGSELENKIASVLDKAI